MKKSLFSNIFKFALFFVAAAVIVTACKDDDDDDDNNNPVIVLDGFYVHGDATASADLASNMMMSTTRNEVGQVDRTTLYEKYIALKANTDFHITQVAGSTQTTWGPGGDFAEVTNPTTDEPQGAPFWRGSLVETSDAFQVPADGLYHVVFDTEFMRVVVARVQWGVIGAATPGGWSGSTALTEGTFGLEAMTFQTTEMEMTLGDFKFRYSDGWKIEIDTTDTNPDNHVKVNTNYGGSVAELVPGGDNINNAESGYYTVTMSWSLANGTTATLERTGDLPLTDYSDVSLGLIGDGFNDADGNQWSWDGGYGLQTPTVDGDVYTWTWDGIEVLSAGSFKIREGEDWNGYSFGYPQVTMAGGAAADFEANGDGNFVPLSDQTVNISFEINAATETYTFTVDAVVK